MKKRSNGIPSFCTPSFLLYTLFFSLHDLQVSRSSTWLHLPSCQAWSPKWEASRMLPPPAHRALVFSHFCPVTTARHSRSQAGSACLPPQKLFQSLVPVFKSTAFSTVPASEQVISLHVFMRRPGSSHVSSSTSAWLAFLPSFSSLPG